MKKLYFLLILVVGSVGAADINITNMTKATTAPAAGFVLGLTNSTGPARLIPVSEIVKTTTNNYPWGSLYDAAGTATAASNDLNTAILARIASATNVFVSPVSAMTVKSNSYAHGLGRVPTEVHLVLVCTNADPNLLYVAGDEIQMWAATDLDTIMPLGVVWATSTRVGYACVDCATALSIGMMVKDGSTWSNPAGVVNFNLKIYAR
jgi:hypothetical protein